MKRNNEEQSSCLATMEEYTALIIEYRKNNIGWIECTNKIQDIAELSKDENIQSPITLEDTKIMGDV